MSHKCPRCLVTLPGLMDGYEERKRMEEVAAYAEEILSRLRVWRNDLAELPGGHRVVRQVIVEMDSALAKNPGSHGENAADIPAASESHEEGQSGVTAGETATPVEPLTGPCPDCDDGTIIETVAECCGRRDRYGECCGMPDPAPSPAPCPRCHGTGKLPPPVEVVSRVEPRLDFAAVPRFPLNEQLFEVANAVRDEIQGKAPSRDMATCLINHQAAWDRILKAMGANIAPEENSHG